MSEFSKRLKFLREANDVPLSKLAEGINTTKASLSRYENNKVEPSLDVAVEIAKYFNVTLDWMVGNGELNDVENHKMRKYDPVVNECIKNDIPPEKILKFIDIMKG